MEQPQLVLGIILYKVVFAEAYARGIFTVVDTLNSGIPLSIKIEQNMYVTHARNSIAAFAVDLYRQGKATHLWMIDDDMLIPAQAAVNLLKHDLPVVGGSYYGRDMRPIAYKLDPFERLRSVPSSGLIRVDGLGCGCTLVKCEILERMQQHYGDLFWFQDTIKTGGNGVGSLGVTSKNRVDEIGEDVFFFVRLKEMGIPVYLDCDVKCGHMGILIVDQEGIELRSKAIDAGLVKDEPVNL